MIFIDIIFLSLPPNSVLQFYFFIYLIFVSFLQGNHAPSCYNLAVLFRKGDVGVDKSDELFKKFQKRTSDLIEIYGSVESKKIA